MLNKYFEILRPTNFKNAVHNKYSIILDIIGLIVNLANISNDYVIFFVSFVKYFSTKVNYLKLVS